MRFSFHPRDRWREQSKIVNTERLLQRRNLLDIPFKTILPEELVLLVLEFFSKRIILILRDNPANRALPTGMLPIARPAVRRNARRPLADCSFITFFPSYCECDPTTPSSMNNNVISAPEHLRQFKTTRCGRAFPEVMMQ